MLGFHSKTTEPTYLLRGSPTKICRFHIKFIKVMMMGKGFCCVSKSAPPVLHKLFVPFWESVKWANDDGAWFSLDLLVWWNGRLILFYDLFYGPICSHSWMRRREICPESEDPCWALYSTHIVYPIVPHLAELAGSRISNYPTKHKVTWYMILLCGILVSAGWTFYSLNIFHAAQFYFSARLNKISLKNETKNL